jgi:hypothetical protein
MARCDRCARETIAVIMSMFNTEDLCLDCKDRERLDPRYPEAVAADEAAMRAGNYNFKGIGRR